MDCALSEHFVFDHVPENAYLGPARLCARRWKRLVQVGKRFERQLFHLNRFICFQKSDNDPGEFGGGLIHQVVRGIFELDQPCPRNGRGDRL